MISAALSRARPVANPSPKIDGEEVISAYPASCATRYHQRQVELVPGAPSRQS